MNVNSSTYASASSAKSSSSSGLSGLMSGMDTESMVEKMLSGTQGKIDKQEALKQQTLWKQEIYRDIITSVNSFYSKFFDSAFDSSLKNNFASSSFFNSMISSVTKGDALKVISTSSNALASEMKVAVKRLASNSSLQSTVEMSGDRTITGTALSDADLVKNFEKSVTLKVDNKEIKVDLNNVTTESGIVDTLNRAFEDANVTGVTAKLVSGRLRFVTEDPSKKVTVNTAASTELGLTMTGLTDAVTSDIKDLNDKVIGTMTNGGFLQPEVGPSFSMTLDGVTKTITLNAVADPTTKAITADSVFNALTNEVKTAFGGYVNVKMNPGTKQLSFSVADANNGRGHELKITGVDADLIGITPGSSTQLTTSSTLAQLGKLLEKPGQPGLQGDRFSFTINGEKFTFTSDQTVGTVINTINNSKAGVKLTYSSLSDTFRMEATASGEKQSIEFSQEEGDFLTRILGKENVAAATSVGSTKLTTGTVQGTPRGLGPGYTTTGASLAMKVNGVTYTYTVPQVDGVIYNGNQIESGFESWLTKTFGESGGKANIAYDAASGQLRVAEGYEVSFTQSRVDLEDAKAVEDAKKTDLALAFGFNFTNNSNLATEDTKISEVLQLGGATGLTGVTFTDKAGNQITDLTSATMKDIGKMTVDGKEYAMDFSGNRLKLTGADGQVVDFSAHPELAKLFGESVTLGDGQMESTNQVKAGTDAIVFINGVETTRNSNSFTMDGVTMQLTKVSAADPNNATSGLEETVIGTTRDVDSIVAGFKSFVDEYNAMLEKVNGYLGQDADYRDYAPLTAAQKKEMSESEIKEWEKKAKTGLVRNDSTVSSLMSALRTALYTKPDGAKFALYNIGIETEQYSDKSGGKLTFNEAALRDALSSDPDAVRQLFTDSADGLSKQLMGAMDSVVKTKGANPGSLVQLAGMPGTTSEKSNSMFEKLTRIESQIKDLKTKYEKERKRYWNQFNSMEKIIANYNSQSAYLMQQFGGY